MNFKKVIKLVSVLALTLAVGASISACSKKTPVKHAETSRIASDGSFTVGAKGVLNTSEVNNKKPIVDIYLDPLCPSCGEFDRETGDYLTKQLKANKLTVRYHPLMFLDQGSTDEYSTRASSYLLGIAEYAPNLAQKFVSSMYSDSFQPKEGEDYKATTNKDLEKLFISIGGTTAQANKISASQKHYGTVTYKATVGVMKNNDLIKKSPTGELYTPFVLVSKQGHNNSKALAIENGKMLSGLKAKIAEVNN